METAEGIHPARPLPTHHTQALADTPPIRLSWGVQARGAWHRVDCIIIA